MMNGADDAYLDRLLKHGCPDGISATARGDKPGNAKTEQEPDMLPDLMTLALALKCYNERVRNGRTIQEVAEKLGIKRDKVYRRINRFRRLFEGDDRLKKETAAPHVRKLYNQVGEILQKWAEIIESRGILRIRLGASKTLARTINSTVVKPFRDRYSAVEIDPQTGFPQALRRRVQDGEFDLVVTSCPEEYKEGEKSEEGLTVIKKIELPMRLICPRGHRLASRHEVVPEDLRGMTLVELDGPPSQEDRLPLPRYPRRLEEEALEIKRKATYEEMHTMVQAGGDIAGFSFAEIMDNAEQETLDTVALSEKDGYKLAVCLLRSDKAREWRSDEQTRLVDELERELASYLDRIAHNPFDDRFVQKVPDTYHVYHVRTITDPKTGAARREWVRGVLDGFRLTTNGYIKANYRTSNPVGGDLRFQVNGTISVNPKNSEECHLVWHGLMNIGTKDEEAYVANFIGTRSDLQQGRLVGVWIGRETSLRDMFYHSAGYYLALSQAKYGAELTDDQLDQFVRDHNNLYGKLSLVLVTDQVDGRDSENQRHNT